MDKREKELHRLTDYPDIMIDDSVPGATGVLLSDELKHYAVEHRMIDPFEEARLKPAGYELTVGDEYALGGNTHTLSDKRGENEIVIPPFEVAIIKTGETINLPRFLIARWNIRVKWAYEGLLWVGGPQVDPGYIGHLFCPIYNLSNKGVKLVLGDAIALMDFVKTTRYESGKSISYKRPPKRVVIEDYNPGSLRSALATEAQSRIEKFEGRVANVEERVERFVSLTFAVIGILFAALWGSPTRLPGGESLV